MALGDGPNFVKWHAIIEAFIGLLAFLLLAASFVALCADGKPLYDGHWVRSHYEGTTWVQGHWEGEKLPMD